MAAGFGQGKSKSLSAAAISSRNKASQLVSAGMALLAIAPLPQKATPPDSATTTG